MRCISAIVDLDQMDEEGGAPVSRSPARRRVHALLVALYELLGWLAVPPFAVAAAPRHTGRRVDAAPAAPTRNPAGAGIAMFIETQYMAALQRFENAAVVSTHADDSSH